MLPHNQGKIILLASLLTFQGGLTVPAYASAKGGIGQLVKALANEWSAHNVHVNAIAPGYVDTDMNAALRADPVRDAQISARIPAARWGSPDDFAGPAVFLASRASQYVCGELLVVDGVRPTSIVPTLPTNQFNFYTPSRDGWAGSAPVSKRKKESLKNEAKRLTQNTRQG